MGSSCYARGNSENLQLINSFIEEHGLETAVELAGSRCEQLCGEGPNIIIDNKIYNSVTKSVLLDILNGQVN